MLQPGQCTPAPGLDTTTFPSWNAATLPSELAGYHQPTSQAAPAQSGNLLQQAYSASNTAVRLSIKLFNCTPAQLPSSLRERVTGWLGSTPPGLEGYICPGCLHLTVQATLPHQPEGGAPPCTPPGTCVRAALAHLLASPEQEVWHKCTMLVQLGNQAAVVHQGVPLKVWNIQGQLSAAHQPPHHHNHQLQQQQQQKQAQHDDSSKQQLGCCGAAPGLPSKLPVLVHAQPVCLVAGEGGEQRVPLLHQGIPADCKVVCRAGGKHLEVQVLHSDEVSDVAADMLQVVVPGGLSVGLLYLEVQRGSFMGPALPVLIAPTAALAAEVVCMLHKTIPADRQGLIVDLGCAMQHVEASRLHRASSAASARAGPSVLYTYMPLIARATQAGLVALVRYLVAAVAPDHLEAVAAYRGQGGMGLLHLGVQSGNLDVLAAVLEESSADCWQGGLAGLGGVTPFHLAVLLPDAQPMALLLAATFGASHWFCSPTHDGHTPADFAVRCGKEHLNHAIGVSMWSQASADESMCQTGKHDDIQQELCGASPNSKPVVEQTPSLSTGGWSDSSSSADDDSDFDASQHGSNKMFTMPEAFCQGLSAAADFMQSRREGLAAVLRQASWFKYDSTK